MLTGSGESFFCTALLDTVELAPASAATNGVITVGNLASREVSSSGAEAFTVVELVVESDVALTVVESDTNDFVVLTVVESDTNDFVVLMVAESDTNAFVLLTSVAESAELPVLLLLVLEEAAAAETGARLTVVVTKSADVNFAIVVFDTTAKNSPETL